MNAIHTTSVVRNGRVTVEVPTRDGTRVDVVIRPVEVEENIGTVLEELRQLRAGSPARIGDPEEVKRAIEEGRP